MRLDNFLLEIMITAFPCSCSTFPSSSDAVDICSLLAMTRAPTMHQMLHHSHYQCEGFEGAVGDGDDDDDFFAHGNQRPR